MGEQRSRVEVIDEVLIYHHNVKKDGKPLECLCGHPLEIGRSIYKHQAEVIDQTLRFYESGDQEVVCRSGRVYLV